MREKSDLETVSGCDDAVVEKNHNIEEKIT